MVQQSADQSRRSPVEAPSASNLCVPAAAPIAESFPQMPDPALNVPLGSHPTLQNDSSRERESVSGSEPAGSRRANFVADTLAMLLFSTPVAMSNDMLMAGLSLKQALVARAVALPVNFISARPYGLYRDKLFGICRVTEKSSERVKTVVDTFAMVTFQGSLYAGILATTGLLTGGGFQLSQIGAAVGSIAALMTVIGRPYGWFRNRVRTRLFHLPGI